MVILDNLARGPKLTLVGAPGPPKATQKSGRLTSKFEIFK